ncbi:MAG: hypothetical protein WAU47_12230 [Desulfobaccales bacterium]
MTRIARILVCFFVILIFTSAVSLAAGPFPYRLPQGPGDSSAITVVGKPQTHHIVRYQNFYQIAQPVRFG